MGCTGLLNERDPIALLGRLWDGDLVAAELALRLAYKKDKLNVLGRLRRERGLAEWAVARLADVPHGVAVAWDLMRDENRGIRVAAADVLWNGVAPELRDRLPSPLHERLALLQRRAMVRRAAVRTGLAR